MRVGFVGPLPPLRGGITHFNVLYIEGLRTLGHDVVPVSYEKLYPSALFPGKSQYDPDLEVDSETVPVLLAWNPFTWLRARRLLKRRKIDTLVLIHWHPFFVPCLWFLAGLKTPHGVALYVHNALPHEKAWLGKLLNPWLYRRVDRMFTGAESEAAVLRRLAPGVPATALLHPVHDRFDKLAGGMSVKEARERIGYTKSQPLLMHLGLVRHYKGVDILLEAMARLPEETAYLEVAGEVYDDESFYLDLIEKLKLGEWVSLNNQYLSDEEMALRLRAADAVVLPYRNATQSGVAMIALSMGTPVIATDVGQLSLVMAHEEYGELVEPENPEALAEAIQRLLNRKSLGSEASRKKTREIAREHFGGWDRFADVMLRPEGNRS